MKRGGVHHGHASKGVGAAAAAGEEEGAHEGAARRVELAFRALKLRGRVGAVRVERKRGDAHTTTTTQTGTDV